MKSYEKWDNRFMQLAQVVAEWSKDPERKVGAVIVDADRRILSLGYNGFPRHVEDTAERYARADIKLHMIVHAEVNAILNSSCSLRHSTLYCTCHPCSICAGIIIQAGIVRVISPPAATTGKWIASHKIARSMFGEAMVAWKQGE